MSLVSDVWEPFVWTVGQRVRVRLSAECAFRYRPVCRQAGVRLAPARHIEKEDGRVGAVVACACQPHEHAGHRYHVVYDSPVHLSARLDMCGMHYAAAELEPAP